MQTRTLSLTLAAAAAALSLGAAAPAFADTYEQIIDRRQDRQEERIDQGIKSGELTRREAARLERGQNHVNRLENRASPTARSPRASSSASSAPRTWRAAGIYGRSTTGKHRPN
jgi:hypothetical protein